MNAHSPTTSIATEAPPDPLAANGDVDGLLPFESYARETWLTYSAYLLGGWFGLHRYYLGRWKTGLLYTFTFGLAGIGWLLDGWKLKRMLRDENERLHQLYQSDPALFAQPRAQWARDAAQQKPSFWGLLAAGIFYLIGPGAFMYLCWTHQRIGMMLLMFFLLVLSYMGANMNTARRMFPNLMAMPGLGTIFRRLLGLEQFYTRHKPGGVCFYLLYPITAPIAMLRSSSARREFLMLGAWLGAIALFSAGEMVLFYHDSFPPFLGPIDAWDLLLFELGVVCIMFFGCLMPAVTIQHRLRHMELHHTKWLYTIVGMVSFGTVLGLVRDERTDRPILPAFEQKLLAKKLEKPSFQKALFAANRSLLHLATNKGKASARRPMTKRAASTTSSGVLAQQQTKAYQKQLMSFMDSSEARGFRVYEFTHKGRRWLGVILDFRFGDPRWLFVLSDKGTWLTQWARLPNAIAKAIQHTTRKIQYPGGPVESPKAQAQQSHMALYTGLLDDQRGVGSST